MPAEGAATDRRRSKSNRRGARGERAGRPRAGGNRPGVLGILASMIRYGRRAVRDLQAIKDYVEPLNPNATRRVFETIKSRIATLETFPQIGKIVDEHGTRRISAGRYPLRDILRN
jgi:plasmid stabilization system protein ParE